MRRTLFQSGMAFILFSAFLWSSFPVLTQVALRDLPVFTIAAATTFCSTVFFFLLLIFDPPRRKPLSLECKKNIAVACVTIGIGYYIFSYVGISLTTPGNAAIVMLMEIFFSYLFISVLARHEPLVRAHVFGAVLMIVGALFVLLPSARELRMGDFILLIGSMLPPLGNLAMQRARKEVSSATIMFWRSLMGTLTLGILAFVFEDVPSLASVRSALPAILFGGFVLLGFSKILWIEAIHRMPITQTISVASIQPLFTMFFAYLLLRQAPEWAQLLSLPPIAAGMFLLTRKKALPKEALEEV